MNRHESINYLELPSSNLEATKTFFSNVFGWTFVDYGEEYTAFKEKSMEGGFYKSDLRSDSSQKGATLVVFYSDDLEDTQQKILKHGGSISIPTFSFPGGKRFHFKDITGNEFAVWTEMSDDI